MDSPDCFHIESRWRFINIFPMDESGKVAVATGRASAVLRMMEMAALFGGLPVLYAAGWIPVPLLVALGIAALGCGIKLAADGGLTRGDWLQWRAPRSEWIRMLARFAVTVPLLAAIVWLAQPDALFALPRIWLLVMLIYPLVSVYPQEIVFRAFFFCRYRSLFGKGWGMVAASAFAFAFAHITFHNWVAIALTLPGGIIFGRSYQRTNALLFVACEHALYGCLIFTVGLGRYLLEGTFRLVQ
jgi:uncharacterized protein